MKNIILIITLTCIYFISGCQTLATMKNGWKDFRNYSKRSEPTDKKLEKVKYKNLTSGKRGYLAAKEEEHAEKIITTTTENEDYAGDLTVKSYSRSELENLVIDLNNKLDNEKTALRRTKEELSDVKLSFQKQIFSMENRLEEQKKDNRDLRDKLTSSELESLKSRQKLTEIKTNIYGRRNLFQSAYPVFYTVKKGDSLWKIAARDNIYDDAYKWLEIYHANQQKIDDHDVIYPGMVLKIPRYFELLMTTFDLQENIIEGEMAPQQTAELKNLKEQSEINEQDINS